MSGFMWAKIGPVWLSPHKIYTLFWIGDIKTDSMDIAFVP